MTIGPLNKPSATGVRIAGDRYQWLVAWAACVSTLRGLELDANPVISVGVEVDGLGNLDDVVVYRQLPPHTFIQVKYTVDQKRPVTEAYLTSLTDSGGPSILEKMHIAWTELKTNEDSVDMVLMTNRAPDPQDVLVAGRDARTGLLLPNAGEGGPRSNKGKARERWASATNLSVNQLLELLTVLRFELAHDVKHVEDNASLQMLASGLRGDADALAAGIGWVEQKVIAGDREFVAEEISNAVDALGLRVGRARTILSIATLKPDPLAPEAVHQLDWVDRFDGVDAYGKRRPLPPATWNELQTDIEAIPFQLGGASRVMVSGSMRLPTAFTVGAALRMVTNLDVDVVQRQELWSTDTPFTDTVKPNVTPHQIDQGHDLAVVVQIAAPAHEAVLQFIADEQLPVDKLLVVTLPNGENDRAISNSFNANAHAYGIRNALRSRVRGVERVHLFLATPMGFALLLGHRWNAMVPATLVYEDLVRLGYEHAFTVTA